MLEVCIALALLGLWVSSNFQAAPQPCHCRCECPSSSFSPLTLIELGVGGVLLGALLGAAGAFRLLRSLPAAGGPLEPRRLLGPAPPRAPEEHDDAFPATRAAAWTRREGSEAEARRRERFG